MKYLNLLIALLCTSLTYGQHLQEETLKHIKAINKQYEIKDCNCEGEDIGFRIYFLQSVIWILHPDDQEKSLIGHRIITGKRKNGIWKGSVYEKFQTTEKTPQSDWQIFEQQLLTLYSKDLPINGDAIYRAGMSCPNSGTIYIEWCDKEGKKTHYFWECLAVVDSMGDKPEICAKAQTTVKQIKRFSELMQREFF